MTELAVLFFGLLGGFAFLLMVLGLFDPRIGLFWTERRTRPQAALVYGGITFVALLLVALFYEPDEVQAWNERGDAILAQMQADYEAGRYTAVIDSAERYMGYVETALVKKLHDRALEDSLETSERTDPAGVAEENRDLYRRLVDFDSANERYLSKLIQYEVELKRERERAAREPHQKKGGQSRKVRNYYVEHAVKDHLKSPDRFEHIETRFVDKGDYLYVVMRFRENGSTADNTAYAIVSLENQLIWLNID